MMHHLSKTKSIIYSLERGNDNKITTRWPLSYALFPVKE